MMHMESYLYGNPGDMSWKKNLGFLKLKHEKQTISGEVENDPDFQNDVARRELGYDAENDKTFRLIKK